MLTYQNIVDFFMYFNKDKSYESLFYFFLFLGIYNLMLNLQILFV